MSRRLIVATVMTALMLPVLIGLGVWQWQRLAWKERLIAQLSAQNDMAPRRIDETFPTLSWTAFDRVEAEGVFDNSQEQRIWSGVDGRTAWRVVTPMFFPRPQPGDHICNFPPVVFVERGLLPDGAARPIDRPLGRVKVKGRLFPSESSRFVPAAGGTPGEWTLADLTALGAALRPPGPQCTGALPSPEALKANLLPLLLVAETSTGDDLRMAPGPRRIELANRHFEYALTWWSFAGILLIIYAVFWRAERRRT